MDEVGGGEFVGGAVEGKGEERTSLKAGHCKENPFPPVLAYCYRRR